MDRPENCILTIFGASGDLTRRKLMPALFALHRQDLLPNKFAILGVGRSEFNDDSYRDDIREALNSFADTTNDDTVGSFLGLLHYEAIDTDDRSHYQKIQKKINQIAQSNELPRNIVYYLAVPPSAYKSIASHLASAGMNDQSETNGWKRLIVEKPFGHDLESAKDLNRALHSYFEEDQVYRIDHFLGKETVQNIMALRFSNGIFEPLWNRNYVDRVEVTSAENIGIGKRAGYYEHSGALRDMVQNHLLQITGTIAMEPPSKFNAREVRNEAVKVFHSLRPIDVDHVDDFVVRGQYMESTIRGEQVAGYRQEERVAADSRTETYVALKMYIDNWRWGGVPFYLRTGKRLPTSVTEVVIHFRKTPHYLFRNEGESDIMCNQLIIRIQPDEGILLRYGMKVPGAGFKIQNVSMDFHYSSLAESYIPAAYERLLMDAMTGDATLFARSDGVEACWKFIDPIEEAWRKNGDSKLYGYPAGTWGPREALHLFDDPDTDWRYPCKNLSNDGEYCEL